MATLDALKKTLRVEASSSSQHLLSDEQYSSGFELLLQGQRWKTYETFIIPQLSQSFTSKLKSQVSVLEIGPGPNTVLGRLSQEQRRMIVNYTAIEPNTTFAPRIEAQLASNGSHETTFPCLTKSAKIHEASFTTSNEYMTDEKFDMVLFCHSMCGMKPKRSFIESALKLLNDEGIIVVFHCGESLHFDGLVCNHTASWPTGLVQISNKDKALDTFTSFVAGFTVQDTTTYSRWREICRELGTTEGGQLQFHSPEIMVTFSRHANTLPELLAQVPVAEVNKIKSPEGRARNPASIVRPTNVHQVQQCVAWALEYGHTLSVLGGSHSAQCLVDNVVAINMSAFNQIDVKPSAKQDAGGSDALVVVGAGCKSGDIISATIAAGLTVPLGALPSVGAGLWLQGGLGHISRQHGLTCDAIIGAVVISVATGDVLCVGHVPQEHQPMGAIRPKNEEELLWAIRGSGTNFGIVISVCFRAAKASQFMVRNWTVPLDDATEAHNYVRALSRIAEAVSNHQSLDLYLFSEEGQLRLGVALVAFHDTGDSVPAVAVASNTSDRISTLLSNEPSSKVVDGIGLFDTEMYISGMHGGHGGGKTSSFKRCVFLSSIQSQEIYEALQRAMHSRPSNLCYFHLLHGGGAIRSTSADATAFGCRDWEYACVVTGVWQRDQDGTAPARAATEWVYKVVEALLPLSSGIYGADLGPDPRDAALATQAFGLNRLRLGRLKHSADPHNVLVYACPLPPGSAKPKLIILVTGQSCAGKDYCAEMWTEFFVRKGFSARAISISDVTKQEYSIAAGADLDRLLHDRAYKEQHRAALTEFFQQQVNERTSRPGEHFSQVVHNAGGIDVLFVTGMRDESPVARFAHLSAESKTLELLVTASQETREARGASQGLTVGGLLDATVSRPDLTFHNDQSEGSHQSGEDFAKRLLLPYIDSEVQQLADMVRMIPDHPEPKVPFHHVLNIAQQSRGLPLSTNLLRATFDLDWTEIRVIACCESGGLVFASPLASELGIPLTLIRKAGKLPPPTWSVKKCPSFISSVTTTPASEEIYQVNQDAVPRNGKVVVVDDVLSTGETILAVLQLLGEGGVAPERITVMVVAEFPVHRGRDYLRQRGFGEVSVHSLLVFEGK